MDIYEEMEKARQRNKEQLKGRRMRICIEGDAWKTEQLYFEISRHFHHNGKELFTVWIDYLP